MGKIIGEGITFDDVLLVPAYSEVIPNQVDVSTYLTKKDQTEHSFDERRNGYGHRAPHGHCHGQTGRYRVSFTKTCRSKQQAEEVDKVKRSENGVITDPILFCPRSIH